MNGNQNLGLYPEIPLSKTEIVYDDIPTSKQTVQMNNNQIAHTTIKKEKYAHARRLNDDNSKNKSNPYIDLLAQTSSMENISSTNEQNPFSVNTNLKAENKLITGQTASNGENEIDNDFDVIDNLKFPQYEEYKEEQNINNEKKNDVFQNNDLLNLGFDFHNYLNNNFETNNFETTKTDTTTNNNINTEKQLSELEGFNFEDNQIFNLNQNSSSESGLIVTDYPSIKVEKKTTTKEVSSNINELINNNTSSSNEFNIDEYLSTNNNAITTDVNTNTFTDNNLDIDSILNKDINTNSNSYTDDNLDINTYINTNSYTSNHLDIDTDINKYIKDDNITNINTDIKQETTEFPIDLTNIEGNNLDNINTYATSTTNLTKAPVTNIINTETSYHDNELNFKEYQMTTNNNVKGVSPEKVGLYLKESKIVKTRESSTQTKNNDINTLNENIGENIFTENKNNKLYQSIEYDSPKTEFSITNIQEPQNKYIPEKITKTNTYIPITENKITEIAPIENQIVSQTAPKNEITTNIPTIITTDIPETKTEITSIPKTDISNIISNVNTTKIPTIIKTDTPMTKKEITSIPKTDISNIISNTFTFPQTSISKFTSTSPVIDIPINTATTTTISQDKIQLLTFIQPTIPNMNTSITSITETPKPTLQIFNNSMTKTETPVTVLPLESKTSFIPPTTFSSPISPITNINTNIFPFESQTQNFGSQFNISSSYMQSQIPLSESFTYFNNNDYNITSPQNPFGNNNNYYPMQNQNIFGAQAEEVVPVEEIEYVPVKKIKYMKKSKSFTSNMPLNSYFPQNQNSFIDYNQSYYQPNITTNIIPYTNSPYNQPNLNTKNIPYSSGSNTTEIDNEIEDPAIPLEERERNTNINNISSQIPPPPPPPLYPYGSFNAPNVPSLRSSFNYGLRTYKPRSLFGKRTKI